MSSVFAVFKNFKNKHYESNQQAMKKHKKSKKRALAAQKEEEGGRRLSKGFWMSIFIVVIMLMSVVGFMWKGGSGGSASEYNGHEFRLTQDRLWQTDHSGQRITFYNHPTEVESIGMDSGAAESLKGTRMAYITSDPDDSLKSYIGKAEFEMKRMMDNRGTYLEYAFTGDNEFNKTIITCRNATPSVPVLYLKSSNETGIVYENNCIIMKAESMHDVMALRDRLLYGFLGVIE